MTFKPTLRPNLFESTQLRKMPPPKTNEYEELEKPPIQRQKLPENAKIMRSEDVLTFMENAAYQQFAVVGDTPTESTDTKTYTYEELRSKGYSDEVINICFDKNGNNYTLKNEYGADLKDIPTNYTENDDRMANLLKSVSDAVSTYAQQARMPKDKVEEMVNKTVYEFVNKAKNGENVMVPDIINKVLDAMKAAENDVNATTFSYSELKSKGYSEKTIELCFSEENGVYSLIQNWTLVDLENVDNDKIKSLVEKTIKRYASSMHISESDLNSMIDAEIQNYNNTYNNTRSTVVPDIVNNLIEQIKTKTAKDCPEISSDEVRDKGYGYMTQRICLYTDAEGIQRIDSFFNQSIGALINNNGVLQTGTPFMELRDKLNHYVKQWSKSQLPDDKISDFVNKFLAKAIGDYQKNGTDIKFIDLVSEIEKMSAEDFDNIYSQSLVVGETTITAAQYELLFGTISNLPPDIEANWYTKNGGVIYKLGDYGNKISDTKQSDTEQYSKFLSKLENDLNALGKYKSEDIRIAVDNAAIYHQLKYKNEGADSTWLDVYNTALEMLEQHKNTNEWNFFTGKDDR